MISLALPKGSLERSTLDLFATAGLAVRRGSDRAYRAAIDYDGVDTVAFFKPREIPFVVESGVFAVGVTGADWLEETGAKVEVVDSFDYAKVTSDRWRLVLAVPDDHPAKCLADLGADVRVATEYPNIGQRFFQEAGQGADVVHSHGATEAKIPELADAIIDVMETGSSLWHNNLRLLATVRTCGAKLIASPDAWRDPARRAVVQDLARLLSAAYLAPAHVMLTIRVPADRLHLVRPALSDNSWRLGSDLFDDDLVVVQGVYAKRGLAKTINAMLDAGAVDITETAIGKLASAQPA
ncbi:ATP phosphoribosyltransferase [Actinokineospora sp. HUAS TT18]|uniref:ATP phosphoribosyltransferase n=1 Tax=Actinokineospora sp. HUAS TT18 TaxID=3447451 RepID=UPI003F51E7EF